MKVVLIPTCRCNLRCASCYRLCHRLDRTDDMPLDRLRDFIAQCESRSDKVTSLSLAGGEAILHPQFADICAMLAQAVAAEIFGTVRVFSNGTLPRPSLPIGLRWQIEPPRIKHHIPFEWSPSDFGYNPRTSVCPSTRRCGYGYGPCGWLPCSPGHSLAHVFELDHLYRPTLADPAVPWGIEELCRHCAFGPDWWSRPYRISEFSDDARRPTSSWFAALQKLNAVGLDHPYNGPPPLKFTGRWYRAVKRSKRARCPHP